MNLSQVTDETEITELITIPVLKRHLQVEHNDDDTYITEISTAARAYVEDHTSRCVMNRSYQLTMDDFCEFEVPVSPVDPNSIAISYQDTDNVTQTFTGFVVSTLNGVAKVRLAYQQSWPDHLAGDDVITVTFDAGYVANKGFMPDPIKHAIKQIVASMYHQRTDTSETREYTLPLSAKYLLQPYKRITI